MSRTIFFVLAAILATASPGAAYFVIELEDGGRVEANFVREEDGKIYASRAAGEIEIDRARVRSVKEVEPGRRMDEEPPGARGIGSAEAVEAGGASGVAADGLRERERRVARELIIGHRELLFARIRGEAPEEIEKRERVLEDLANRRIELREKLAPWERGR